jgi:photosystem II stability/assembly factor-like uncharacterized protein
MNRVLLISLLFTSLSHAQWTVHQAPSNMLTGIYFADSLNGWVGGSGGIFHTTDGADTWVLQCPWRVTHMAGFGTRECWATGVRDTLLHTTNAGNSWARVWLGNALDSIGFLGRICFVDSLHGWVAAGRGTGSWILRTNDAGATWSPFLIGLFASHRLCTFVDTLTGWVAGSAPEVFRTTDGGFTWGFASYAPIWVYDIQFVTREVGWVSVQAGVEPTLVAKSTDGGQTWSAQNGWAACSPFLFFVDTLCGWVVVDCSSWVQITHTSDGGTTWTLQFTYPSSRPSRIFFADRSHGWVIGEDGLLFRTRNGGITSVKSESEGTPRDFKLSQNYPNPFNSQTRIHFELPQDNPVHLVVSDLLGHEVTTVVNEFKEAGRYDVTFTATNLATGVYFYRLQAGAFNDVKKLLLLR